MRSPVVFETYTLNIAVNPQDVKPEAMMKTGKRESRQRALQRQIARLERGVASLEGISRRYSWARLAVIVAGLAAGALLNALLGSAFGWGVIAAFLVAFVIIARYHNRIETGLARRRLWLRIKSAHLARMRLDWDHIPLPPPAQPLPDHPFETDLNLTGARSLCHLIDTARSQGGSNRLRAWLLRPVPNPAEARRRQHAVRELLPLSGFRDRLALCSALAALETDGRWDGTPVCHWLDAHAAHPSLARYAALLSALAGLNLLLAALHALSLTPPLWPASLTAYLLLYVGLYMFKLRDLGALLPDAERLESALKPFRAVLRCLETRRAPGGSHLHKLLDPLQGKGRRPSEHLRQVLRIAGAASWQRGQILWLILNTAVPWDLYFAYRLDRCKTALKTCLPAWLDTCYELEALSALAGFGHLNTETTFPDLLDSAPNGAPVLVARALGHPLLPAGSRVCNDFTFRQPGHIAIVTGSNMSGKSTFLRTLGLNLCLAGAGGPVLASSLRAAPLRLFTCIHVTDSVTDGISYFYAEVKRLKSLLQALPGHPPVCFLIDEIFRGTNNRERLTGSRAYIRALARSGSVGVIATHDLELAGLADALPGIRNGHFRETVHNGRMIFDYRLRPGPCPTTNALKIMRLEGLPIDDGEMQNEKCKMQNGNRKR